MTPQLVDHAHTDSCIVTGCNLVQPRRKMNMFMFMYVAVTSQLRRSCITVAVTIVNTKSRDVA